MSLEKKTYNYPMLVLKKVSNKYDVRKQTVFIWLIIGVVTRSVEW